MRTRLPWKATAFAGAVLALTSMPATAQTYQVPPPGPVTVSPQPGTISASPTSQISFRGRPAQELGTIRVRGSRSGNHTGRVRRHSDNLGASWIPSKRFRQGETVTVSTSLTIAGVRNGDWSFRVGAFPARVHIPHLILEDIPPGRLRRFHSRPDLRPPVVTISSGGRPTEQGYVFLSPKSKKDLKQAGPMIVDNSGRLVWFRPLPGITAATDFRAQTYRGKPVLTYWEGTSRIGIGVGDLVILDDTYQEIRRFKAPNGFRPDLHEFVITPNDTALIISYPIARANLSSIKGHRNGLVVDSVIQEIDIATGLIVFEWHSLGRIALNETFSVPVRQPGAVFDYAHFNSVNLDTDGDFLVSARNTWAVYKIDRETGRITWRLGGKRSTFRLGSGVKFAWQHDAQRRADGAITLFDNSAFPPVRRRSRAVAISVDERSRRATLRSARVHPRGLLAATQGNVQNLRGGGIFVNWGSQRYFTEYDAAGRVLWDARLALGYESYRGYRMPWVGRPHTTPRAAGVKRRGGGMDVYASWNGATEVVTWEALGGSSPSQLKPLGSHAYSGFETRIGVPRRTTYVAVRARDAAGNVMSTSPARRVRG